MAYIAALDSRSVQAVEGMISCSDHDLVNDEHRSCIIPGVAKPPVTPIRPGCSPNIQGIGDDVQKICLPSYEMHMAGHEVKWRQPVLIDGL